MIAARPCRGFGLKSSVAAVQPFRTAGSRSRCGKGVHPREPTARLPPCGTDDRRCRSWRRPRHTLKNRQDAEAVAASRRRLAELRRQATIGAIDLLFLDESEARTHPYLAHCWAKRGLDLRLEAPGQAKRRAMLGAFDAARSKLLVHTSATKRSSDFVGLLDAIGQTYGERERLKPLVVVMDTERQRRSGRSIPASSPPRRLPNGLGSRSNGCPNMPPSSIPSSGSGAISKTGWLSLSPLPWTNSLLCS
jgi:hypothetical protein